MWSLHLALMNAAVHLCITEILYLEYFNNDLWRVQVAKMLSISYSLEGVKILEWGYANIPIQCMDLNLHFLVCWICLTLINAAYITDHPKYTEIVEGRDFVSMLLEKLEPKFQRGGEFYKFFTQIIKTKQHFHNINRMVNPVPSIIVNSAITEEDLDPWFIIGSPPCAGSGCCLLANNNIALRVLSLTYYIDHPSALNDFGSVEGFTDLLHSFSAALDFSHKKSAICKRINGQEKRKTPNSIYMLIERNDDISDKNTRTLNIRKPPEYYLWSKRSTRASTKSLFRLLFPKRRVAGCDIDYSLN
ncbi:hypothetical protein AX774_g1447 [Zancudomyces culisetae]|uniref:Uncharacterized protein n=1 Tax=Zancudomyces culisetae TaxID=1213189 RepID=A0A1R1PVM4_ZANCU|nr:hypothetical protein AX774_g1447 [Zancudomyces culisetae]|eukprot:OMH85017.1 hypothetical protein AX774_g1447 [Zancudomyces culisetae]